jgi:glyoxylase-like metal-dependent hydrolase (beta-lactamase superfamily II)
MRISSHCYAITGLGYSTPWSVNAGLVAGEAETLIVDTGANTLAAQSIYGYAVAVKPTNALRVVNTEKHFDHVGSNGFFRSHGVEIWAHPEAARSETEFAAEMAEFNLQIGNRVRRGRNEAKAFFFETEVTAPTHKISSDTQFELGGCTVQILLTPGHTPTNLCVWVPDDRVLYTGDCLIREYLPNLEAGTPEDWRVWLSSLDRIEALQPAIVVTGHGPVSRVDEIPRMIDAVRQVLAEAIRRGVPPTASV